MRVIVATRIYRPEPAAASLVLGAIADALTARGHEVEVYTVTPPKGLRSMPRAERVRGFPVLRDRQGYVRGYVQYMSFDIPLFFRLLFAQRPDAVFVEPPPTTGAVARFVCALRRIPYVYDTADIWSDAAAHATDSSLVIRVLRGIERIALQGATSLVTISQGVVDRVRALGVTTSAEITGFGADTDSFFYREQESLDPVFLYAGTFSELHGASILIDAFAEFHKTHPEFRLAFLGNGTGQDEMLARAAIYGIEESVTFNAPVSSAELNERFSRATGSLATLLPGGRYEYAFTTKIYSSLASGCPVIFAGPGPTRDFLLGASAHVPAGTATDYDPKQIADAMSALADAPPRPDLRGEIAAWTKANHSMAAVASRVATVIERSIEGKARR